MMYKANIKWTSMSDSALIENIAVFIKHHRLQQNKTQLQLASDAGINRATLSQFENGVSINLVTLIQLLRALKQLHVLQEFQVKQQISPLQLAKLEQGQRIRARNTTTKTDKKKPTSDW